MGAAVGFFAIGGTGVDLLDVTWTGEETGSTVSFTRERTPRTMPTEPTHRQQFRHAFRSIRSSVVLVR